MIVTADLQSDAAGLAQQRVALPDPHDGGIDTALHLKHPREPQNPLMLLFALGDVPMSTAIAGNLPVGADQREKVAFEPTTLPVGIFPAADDSRDRSLPGVEPM